MFVTFTGERSAAQAAGEGGECGCEDGEGGGGCEGGEGGGGRGGGETGRETPGSGEESLCGQDTLTATGKIQDSVSRAVVTLKLKR